MNHKNFLIVSLLLSVLSLSMYIALGLNTADEQTALAKSSQELQKKTSVEKTRETSTVLGESNFISDVLGGEGIIVSSGEIPTITNAGVLSLQNASGALLLSEGEGIAIDGLTIANTGVTSLQGSTGDVNFAAGSGIGIDGLTMNNTDRGSSQHIFKTISVEGTSFSAGFNNDMLQFTAGTGVILGTDTSNKKITITSTAYIPTGLTVNALLYSDTTSSLDSLDLGTSGYLLQSNGNDPPSWVDSSSLMTSSLSFSTISDGTTTATLTIGNGSVLSADGTGMINATQLLGNTWATPGMIGSTTPSAAAFTTLATSGQVQFANLGAGIAHVNNSGVLSSSMLDLTTDVSGVLPVSNGGTGLSSYAAGDLLYYDGTGLSKLGVGGNNTVLTSSGTLPQWSETVKVGGTFTANGTVRTNSLFWLSNGNTGTSTVLRIENYSNSASATGIGFASKLFGTDNTGTEWQYFKVVKDQTWTGTATTRDAYLSFNTLSDNVTKEALRLGSNGNIGINATNPQEKLHIANGNIRVGNGSLCVKGTDASCAGNTAGTIYASNTTVQAADIAENYISSQQLEPGDIVMPAGSSEQSVTKTTMAYQSQVIGVVSTKPGVTLNSDAQTDAAHPYLYPIALSGRVPVKVSTENGEITVGDLLTTSSIPGVAMKASKQGTYIGKALQSYTGNGVGKVMVFVTLSSALPENIALAPPTLAPSFDISSLQSQIASLSAKILALPDFSSLMERLDLIEQTIASQSSEKKTISGSGMIAKGTDSIEIMLSDITESSKILLTPTSLIDVPLVVVEKNPGKSFVVKVARISNYDVQFDWLLVH